MGTSVVQDPTTGYYAVFLAIFFFGTNYIPVKHIKVGDGVFFQFVMCVAILLTSFPVLFYLAGAFPARTEEFGIAMMGGFLWCTGNMMCSLIIQMIGMGMGLLIWGSLNMLMGWASGSFGLFGLTAEPISIPAWNYAGVGLALVGLALFLQVEPSDDDDISADVIASSGTYKSLSTSESFASNRMQRAVSYNSMARTTSSGFLATMGDTANPTNDEVADVELVLPGESLEAGHVLELRLQGGERYRSSRAESIDDSDVLKECSRGQKRFVGVLMACVVGCFFGCSFNPAQWVIDNQPYTAAPEPTLVFIFPHFCGIALCSFLYFVMYCAIMQYHYRRRPYVTPEVVLPATVCGLMWGIAEISWFVANENLGFSIAFPLITSGPGFVGALWGIFVFKEIRGSRNLCTLGMAAAVTVCGLVLVGLSR